MTLYYECGIPAELVPVKFLGWAPTPLHDATGAYNVVIKLKRKPKFTDYAKGEVLHVPAWSVVEKAGTCGGHQRVRPARLPAVNESQLFKSRW